MISAEAFVEPALMRGFEWYGGVPCSYLTPFINHVLADDRLSYLNAANEGDAVAAAAGLHLGGRRGIVMMQNSGLGNAINPLVSLACPFRIPMLLIVTLRGAPGTADEPQHELMGRITAGLLEQAQVPWSRFPDEPDAVLPTLERAGRHMDETRLPYALIMHKGDVARTAPAPDPAVTEARAAASSPEPRDADDLGAGTGSGTAGSRSALLSRREALARILELTDVDSSVVIGTTGYTGRELFALADRPNHFYMVGSMGCASSLGLGLSRARPDLQVVVIDGDGAALMRLGNFAAIGAQAGPNLVHVLLRNGIHETTGGQQTVSGTTSFARVARACGYETVEAGSDLDVLDRVLARPRGRGPAFAELHIRPGVSEPLPRPDRSPAEVARRLMQHFGSQP